MSASPALDVRLNMLDEDLSGVLAGLQKLEADLTDLGTAERVNMLLLRTVTVLQRKIITLRTDVKEKPLATKWIEYGCLRETGDQVYREFLEIVGGVAIRKREIDEKICLVAQELVRGALDPPSMTIVVLGNSRVPNLSRLMRIRFSDRTVWTLPLTAHQFAHLMLEDHKDDLKDFILRKAEAEVGPASPDTALAAADPESRRRQIARNKSLEAVRIRWEQMIADCIAVFIVGPCYAGSAVMFQFSPVATSAETEGWTHDIERAHVCLEMLRALDKQADDSPYGEFIQWLEQLWAQMLADAGNPEALTASRKTELNSFVEEVYQILDQNLPYAQYPIYAGPNLLNLGGWTIATQWARAWMQQAKGGGASGMQIPTDLGKSSKVGDALNAAWLCRSKLSIAGDVRELTQLVRNVCDKIITEVHKPTDPGSVPPQGPTGSRGR
jgi:hypothetical protein